MNYWPDVNLTSSFDKNYLSIPIQYNNRHSKNTRGINFLLVSNAGTRRVIKQWVKQFEIRYSPRPLFRTRNRLRNQTICIVGVELNTITQHHQALKTTATHSWKWLSCSCSCTKKKRRTWKQFSLFSCCSFSLKKKKKIMFYFSIKIFQAPQVNFRYRFISI